MTRIEENNDQNNVSDLEAEVEKLKKSLKRKQNRKFFSCGNCLLLFIIFILGCALFSAYVLAKSGLVELPILSAKFYQEPQPEYRIKTENLTAAEKDLWAVLLKNAKEQILIQKKVNNFNLDLKLSEAQLTNFLREEIRSNDSLNKKIDFIQLAVKSDNLELFAKLKAPKMYMILNLKPMIKNNKLEIAVEQFKIGNLKLPKFLGSLGLTFLLEKSLNNLLALNNDLISISGIELMPRFVTVKMLVKSINF
ncbi:MAG: hypothetical protein NT116_01720 [Candidatus Parcubacteria bacterium]|nr:hypothetical protein [Candidatus Parcubacteria bacterium]